MDRVGYHPGMLWALVVGLNEVISGALLAVGLLTRPAAAAVTIQMLFVIPITIKRGWFGDNELALLWLSVAIFFLIRGGGRCSVDRTIRWEF